MAFVQSVDQPTRLNFCKYNISFSVYEYPGGSDNIAAVRSTLKRTFQIQENENDSLFILRIITQRALELAARYSVTTMISNYSEYEEQLDDVPGVALEIDFLLLAESNGSFAILREFANGFLHNISSYFAKNGLTADGSSMEIALGQMITGIEVKQ